MLAPVQVQAVVAQRLIELGLQGQPVTVERAVSVFDREARDPDALLVELSFLGMPCLLTFRLFTSADAGKRRREVDEVLAGAAALHDRRVVVHAELILDSVNVLVEALLAPTQGPSTMAGAQLKPVFEMFWHSDLVFELAAQDRRP